MAETKWHKVVFRAPNKGTIVGSTLEIDGKEIGKLRHFSYHAGIDRPNIVRIEFLADDVEIESEGYVETASRIDE